MGLCAYKPLYNFQQWISWLSHRWRTQRNAISNVNCRIQWIIESLNAPCAPWYSEEHACLSVINIYQPLSLSLWVEFGGWMWGFCFCWQLYVSHSFLFFSPQKNREKKDTSQLPWNSLAEQNFMWTCSLVLIIFIYAIWQWSKFSFLIKNKSKKKHSSIWTTFLFYLFILLLMWPQIR